MIPRVDLGVDRTVCMIMEYTDCTLMGGQATNSKSVSLADAEKYALATWAASKK
jgi:hypothetical protein